MEEIIIKEITVKPSGVVVIKMNGNRVATLAKWQSQELDYIQNDVGIGGRVKCDVVQNGEYTNIKNVDFASAVKNEADGECRACMGKGCHMCSAQPTPQETRGLMSVKDIQIISQCLTKAWASSSSHEPSPQAVLDTYRFFVKSFEEEG